jgi:pyridoxal phosphate enzyme (YggS family)
MQERDRCENIKILDIQNKISEILNHTKKYNADVMAVIKYAKKAQIISLINDGRIKILGENRVQDSISRWQKDLDLIPFKNNYDIHFIGHLQKNKVKYSINLFNSIDSIDSYELAILINEFAQKNNKKVPVMLQLKINERETQYGIKESDFDKEYNMISRLPNVIVRGIMCIGPLTDDEKEIAQAFRKARSVYERYFTDEFSLGFKNYLSMGMSSDYKIALEEGANLIRIGSFLFSN